jgi:hypothetical protein
MQKRIGVQSSCIFLLFFSLSLFAQSSSSWTVRLEWVHAHEMFLASDAMRGRGSATPDELIAATYVASEFEMYGLKPGLADGTYIQRVELVQPVSDGKARILAENNKNFVPVQEGSDFRIERSTGQSVSGPLQKLSADDVLAHVQPGAIVLLSEDTNPTLVRSIGRSGAAALLLVEPSLRPSSSQADGRAVRPHLPGVASAMQRRGFTVAEITPSVGERLARLADGAQVTLKIHTTDSPRYTYNAVGVLPGKDTSATSKVILLSAHLDHLGIGRAVNGDDIYNGANDDASGTTAVMELAHALAAGPQPDRTIYFVCYGSEELGGLGSTYFREHPPVALDRIAANIEFEMIGNQDPKMPKGHLLLTGYNRSNLGPMLVEHGALLGADPYPEQHFFQRSDNYPLALKGVVAQTAAGWGTPPTYHQPDDDMEHLDLRFMAEAIQSLIEPVRWLANSDFVPHWLPGQESNAR